MATSPRIKLAIARLHVDIAKGWWPFDPHKHPRGPKGSHDGGKFVSEHGPGLFDPKVHSAPGHTKPINEKSVQHPAVDDKGRTVFIHRPSQPGTPEAWHDPHAVATVRPGDPVPAVLNGVSTKAWNPGEDFDWTKVDGQNPALEAHLPDLEAGPKWMHPSAGVIIEEPDGRIWLTRPTNGYGGYDHTFPKGTQEHGLTLQQTAIKEAWEETGLKVKLIGVLGDFKRTTSMARYYYAKRVGGDPSKQGWESQALRLVPPHKMKSFLNKDVDYHIADVLADDHLLGKSRAERETFLGESYAELVKAASAELELENRLDIIEKYAKGADADGDGENEGRKGNGKTGVKPEKVVPGLHPASAAIMFEVAPDPNDTRLTGMWNGLDNETKRAVSHEVADAIVPLTMKQLGAQGTSEEQIGGYMGSVNPSLALTTDPAHAVDAAKLLGYALSQDSMMVVSDHAAPGLAKVSTVTVHLPAHFGMQEVTSLYSKMYELQGPDKRPLVEGFTVQDSNLIILNYSSVKSPQLASMIDEALGHGYDISHGSAYSAFIGKEEYGDAGNRSDQGAGVRGQGSGDLRRQASAILTRKIAEHQGRKRAGYASAGHRPTLSVAKARLIEGWLDRYTVAKAAPPTGPFDPNKHPRWPKGTPLGGKFMSMDDEGFPMPPEIGSAANAEHQVQANAMYAAAKAGDWNALDLSAQKHATKFIQLGGKVHGGWVGAEGAQLDFPTKGPDGKALSSQQKWSMQKLQYAQALVDAKGNHAQLEAKVDAVAGPADLASYKKLGGKLGGTSQGAVMADASGTKYYVKGTPGSGNVGDDRSHNEILASKLIAAADAGGPEMHLVTGLDKAGLGKAGQLGVASKFIEGDSLKTALSAAPDMAKKLLQKDFAVHAWLSNYDVVGQEFDNTKIVGGKAVNIDPGGALLFRAQGATKFPDLPFGQMPSDPTEWDSLRSSSKNSQTASIYGSMTASQLQDSAKKLQLVDDQTISKLVATYGPGDAKAKVALENSLINRRDAILAKVGLESPGKIGASAAMAAPESKPLPINSTAGLSPDIKGIPVPRKSGGLTSPTKDDFTKAGVANTTSLEAHMTQVSAITKDWSNGDKEGLKWHIANFAPDDGMTPLGQKVAGLKHAYATAALADLEAKGGGQVKSALSEDLSPPNTDAFMGTAGSKIARVAQAEHLQELHDKAIAGDPKALDDLKLAAAGHHKQKLDGIAGGAVSHNNAVLGDYAEKLIAHAEGHKVNAMPGEAAAMAYKAPTLDEWKAKLRETNAAAKAKGASSGGVSVDSWSKYAHDQLALTPGTAAWDKAKAEQEKWDNGSSTLSIQHASQAISAEMAKKEASVSGKAPAKQPIPSDKKPGWQHDPNHVDTDAYVPHPRDIHALQGNAEAALAELKSGGTFQTSGNQAVLAIAHATQTNGQLSDLEHAASILNDKPWRGITPEPVGSYASQAKHAILAYHDAVKAKLEAGAAPASFTPVADPPKMPTKALMMKEGHSEQTANMTVATLKAMQQFHKNGDAEAIKAYLAKGATFSQDGTFSGDTKAAWLKVAKPYGEGLVAHLAAVDAAHSSIDAAQAKHVEGLKTVDLSTSPTVPGVPKLTGKPPTYGAPTDKYYEKLTAKLETAYNAGDLSAVKAMHLKADGLSSAIGKLSKDGAALTANGKLFTAYQAHLAAQLEPHSIEQQAAKVEAAINLHADAPAPGEHLANLPAMPKFDELKMLGTDKNAKSFNNKLAEIADAADKGNAKGILALGFGSNTYGKKAASVANNALSALGIGDIVTPGQKANTHPALTGGLTPGEAAAAMHNAGKAFDPQSIAPKKTTIDLSLKGNELPAQTDFVHGNGGKGLSSKAHVNEANQKLMDQLVTLAKKGDLAGLKAATFPEISKETGLATGKVLPVAQHPSKNITTFQNDAIEIMTEKANPPDPLKEFKAKAAADGIAGLAAQFPAKPLGVHVGKVASNEKAGYYIALGKVSGYEELVPPKQVKYTAQMIAQAKADYQQMSSQAKSFISHVQGSSNSYLSPLRDGSFTNDSSLAKSIDAAYHYSRELPAGTTIWGYKNMSTEMLKKIAAASPGLIIQDPSGGCWSYGEGATTGFGNNEVEIVAAPGARAINSFGSGKFNGEKEVTILPGTRFIVLSHSTKAPNVHGHHVKLLMLPPDPKFTKKGYAFK